MQGLTKLIAGDSLAFTTTVPDYPATDGWTLKFRLIPRFTSPVQAPITLTATTYETTGYRVDVGASTTSGWAPGAYSWASWVEQTGQRVTVEQGGELTVAPDPGAAAQGTDVRSDSQRALDNARTALAAYTQSNGNVAEYEIAGRRMRFSSAADIVKLINHLQGEVVRERRAASIAAGLGNPSRIGVRLSRV
jgi:hypothetical protein